MFGTTAALSRQQRDLLDRWIPGAEIVRDHSWGLVQSTVLEVVHDGRRLIVKAGGPEDGHISRELAAHRQWLTPLTSIGRAPELLHGDEDAKLIVTRHLPGELVLGHPSAGEPETYRQAGELLARLHSQSATLDSDYERQQSRRTLAWLDSPHRIPADLVAEVRARVATWPDEPATLVPTHGDWQPRNWLIANGVVFVIDFGRAAMRPAFTDLARLSYRDFARDQRLEAAFFDGYGRDPRQPDAWLRNQVREGVSTAAWAHQVGDETFAEEGLQLLRRSLQQAW